MVSISWQPRRKAITTIPKPTIPVRCASLWVPKTRGLSYDNLALCDEWVKIPMLGTIESLNVSVAAGILIYEAVNKNQLRYEKEIAVDAHSLFIGSVECGTSPEVGRQSQTCRFFRW